MAVEKHLVKALDATANPKGGTEYWYWQSPIRSKENFCHPCEKKYENMHPVNLGLQTKNLSLMTEHLIDCSF